MKIVFILILSAFSVFSVKASPQETLKKVPENNALVTSFTQTRHLKSIPTPLISTGTLKLRPQKGLIWTTVHPFPNTFLISKAGLYQIEDGKPQALEKASQNNVIFKTLSAILAGDFLKGLEGFDVTLLPENNSRWHVKLTPQNPQLKSFIKALSIQGHEQVQKVTIYRANGDYDDIVFTKHKIVSLKRAFSTRQLGWFND